MAKIVISPEINLYTGCSKRLRDPDLDWTPVELSESRSARLLQDELGAIVFISYQLCEIDVQHGFVKSGHSTA